MSIQPNTLENLYSKGIIDYVPYDICVPIQGQYLNDAMGGNLYQNAYSQDSFHANEPINTRKKSKIPSWTKGLASLLVLVGTAFYMLKGKKNNSNTPLKTSFWARLNPFHK